MGGGWHGEGVGWQGEGVGGGREKGWGVAGRRGGGWQAEGVQAYQLALESQGF